MNETTNTSGRRDPRPFLTRPAADVINDLHAQIEQAPTAGMLNRPRHRRMGQVEARPPRAAHAPASAFPPLPEKSLYLLGELLRGVDVEFIENAYLALLRRPADRAGCDGLLDALRAGRLTKVDIIALLSRSEEGQRVGVIVQGLRWPALLHRWKRRRWVGPWVAWLHAAVRLGTTAGRQAVLENAQARELQSLQAATAEVVSGMESRIDVLDRSMPRPGELDEVMSVLDTRGWDVEALKEQLARQASAFESLSARVAVGELLEKQRARGGDPGGLDQLYADFEDSFRGSESLVRARVMPYLPLVQAAGAGTADAPVVDIGSGRGEWLELLRENGIQARGIDLNHIFIAACAAKGLDVVHGDALDVLKRMPSGSAGAITSMHLVEHLPFEVLVSLIDESLRVLRPGGLLILETPNPENLEVGSFWFFMDPTHRNPLPPDLLQWLVRSRGFGEARIERLHEAREMNPPPLLDADVPGAASVNALLAKFHVAPDYAIVGVRE